MENNKKVTDYRDAETIAQMKEIARQKEQRDKAAVPANRPAPTRVRGISID